MSEPSIVTPQEARAWVESPMGLLFVTAGERVERLDRLTDTVATELDRTRAAVVEALRNYAMIYRSSDAESEATNIENGADW